MIQGLLHLHNFMRWVVLLTALYAIIQGLGGMSGNKSFNPGGKRAGLFYLISCDIQLLLGLFLYFKNHWFAVLTAGSETMKNATLRFFSLEHSLGMIIAIVLVHIGYSATKKNIEDKAKFKKLFWFSLISFIIIMATIPWPFREAVSRSWFPGM